MSKKKSAVLAGVLKALQRYQRDKDHELHDIAKKLAPDDPEKAQMWKYLEEVVEITERLKSVPIVGKYPTTLPELGESPIPEYAHVGKWLFDIIKFLNFKKCNQDEKKECAPHLDYIRRCIATEPDHELYAVSETLTVDNIKLVKTWRFLLKGKPLDEKEEWNKYDWVTLFLIHTFEASSVQPYHDLSMKEKEILKNDFKNLSTEYTSKLERHGLDLHLFHLSSKACPGWYSYESWGEKSKKYIDEQKYPKIKASCIVSNVTEEVCKMISDDPGKAKKGKRFRSVRFVKLMAESNHRLYGFVLPSVIAKAANAIFPEEDNRHDARSILSTINGA